MTKIFKSFFLSLIFISSSYAASSIILPTNIEIKPANTNVISLDPLISNALYNITCHITNIHAEPVAMRFDITPLKGSSSLFSLNNEPLPNNQGLLQSGDNIIDVAINQQGKNNALQFTNLDLNHAVKIDQCIANPIVRSHLKDKFSAGYIIVANDTYKPVEVKVGTFFPTPYYIRARSSRLVYMTTDNQNITVSKIYN